MSTPMEIATAPRDAKTSDFTPWIEKYRPKTLDDIAHQEEVVSTLKNSLQNANLQHLLFYGPPGTGKTSTILAVARQLYGPDLMKDRVLELNASSERGIEAVRHKIKNFAQLAVGSRDNVPGYPCPPYKIIILDEADSMTRDAQSALRRTMEQYNKVTRFCIICNYVTRIIEPITSRCAKFRYKLLSKESMKSRLQHVADSENIQVSEETLETLVQVSDGDMRKSITMLQSAEQLVGDDQLLAPEHVIEAAGVIPDQVIEHVIDVCKGNSFGPIQEAAENIIANAYPIDQLLSQLQPRIIGDSKISDTHKAKICIRIAQADKKLIDGADEFLQLMDVMSVISTTILEATAL